MTQHQPKSVTYLFDGDLRERRHLYLKLLFLGVVMTAAGLVCGLIRAPGTLTALYVLVPFTIAFGTTLSLVWALIRMWKGGAVLSQEDYQATLEQFPPRGICTAVCAGCAMAGEAFYVFRNGAGDLVSGMVLFLICQAIELAGAVLWVHITENSPWRKQED